MKSSQFKLSTKRMTVEVCQSLTLAFFSPVQLSGRRIRTAVRQHFFGQNCGDSHDLSSVRTPPAGAGESNETQLVKVSRQPQIQTSNILNRSLVILSNKNISKCKVRWGLIIIPCIFPHSTFGLYMCIVERRHVTHSRKKNIHIKHETLYSQYKATDMGFILWLVLFLLQYDHREPLLKGTFILCDSALSKSLLRAASIERVAEDTGTPLLLAGAPGATLVDTVLVSAPVTADGRFICWLLRAKEVTLTI